MDIKKEIDTIYTNLDNILKTNGINQAMLVADTAVRLRNIYNELEVQDERITDNPE